MFLLFLLCFSKLNVCFVDEYAPAGSTSCTQCEAGFECSGGVSSQCGAGYYSASGGGYLFDTLRGRLFEINNNVS